MNQQPVLEIEGLSTGYGSLVAVSSASLTVRRRRDRGAVRSKRRRQDLDPTRHGRGTSP